jgi:D-alanyl-D-alanine carboxypeptidase/D-alanyl-D-alanine-endopeptidase (penicillin-binding protein 4)
MPRNGTFAPRLSRRLSSHAVPSGASEKILVLCAAVALCWSAAAVAATGGASSPTGASGATGPSGATGATGATTLTPLAKLERKMAAAMKPLGSDSGAYVYDLATGQVLYDHDGEVPRSPASVEKLYTLTAALDLFGPSGTLTTTVYGVGTLEPGGVWDGNLYLRGGGDPTFGDVRFIKDWYGEGTSVGALAAKLIAATHITRVDGSIIGDESYFDSLRGDPASNFGPDPNLVGELSALSFDRGAVGRQGTPAAHAAWELSGALYRDHVKVIGHAGQGVTPAGARELTSVSSPPMSALADLTATPSDDFFAEMILKALGARFGAGGSTAGGAAVVKRVLAGLRLTAQIVDGSGLSRADLTSPQQVVTLLRDLSPGGVASLQLVGADLRAALPVIGKTGTLVGRMVGSAADGNCEAKTGTLSDASDLAGWCDGNYVFALLMNDVDVAKAEKAQDKIVEALASYGAPKVAELHPSSARKPASSSTGTSSR